MKFTYQFLLLLILCSFSLIAQDQDDLELSDEEQEESFSEALVSIEKKSMTKGINDALVLELANSRKKLVEKLWKKYIKQFKANTKKVKRSDEFLSHAARISSISAEPVNLYSSFTERGNDVYLSLWIEMEEDNFFSSSENSDVFLEAENILVHFAGEVEKENIRIELQEEQKRLKKLEIVLKKLERNNDSYHKDIESAKARIVKAEEKIIANEKEQEDTQAMILEQSEIVNNVKERLKSKEQQ